jgi:antirestriction protein ArdC
MTTNELQSEALTRAVSSQSMANWHAVIVGFTAMGIPESDIKPRENVFTYHAWRALGRQVRRGEHGVKVMTWVTPKDRGDERAKGRGKMPWCATVFHISQTDPI